MKITKFLLTAVISVILLSVCAFALGDDVIVDMGPIFEELGKVNTGHINDDGVIDAKDVSLLGTILATGGENYSNEQLAAANGYTGDNNGTTAVINIKDLIALAQLVYKIENAPKDDRIISKSTSAKDENEVCYNYYDVFNPYLGRKEELKGSRPGEITTVMDYALPTGTVATVKNGEVYENEGYAAEDVINPETDFVWITNYNPEAHTITVLPETSTDTSDEVYYTYTENSGISKLSYAKKTDIFKWGTMNHVDTADFFEDPDKQYYKCYNDKILVGDVYKTRYAKYVKAYISPIEGTNIIDYAIIIVHDEEAVENLNM